MQETVFSLSHLLLLKGHSNLVKTMSVVARSDRSDLQKHHKQLRTER